MHSSTLILDAFWVDKKPFPTAQNDNSDDGKIFHKYYTGPARYIGWLDLVLLNDLIKKHHITHIILQNLDILGKIAKEVGRSKICVAYHYKSFVVNKPYLKDKKLDFKHCIPIYNDARIGGWEFSNEDEKLSMAVENYIRFILIHTHVDSITCMNNKIKVTAHWDESGNVVFDTEPNL